MKNTILQLPLTAVLRAEIALPLQHVLQLYTVGCFLSAWRNPRNQKSIEEVFDTPEQARHAAAVCSTWLGLKTETAPTAVPQWWPTDPQPTLDA